MAGISPFAALRFNPERIGDLGQVLALPYDRVDAETRQRMLQQHAYNVVRLTPTRQELAENGAASLAPQVASLLGEWRREKILIRDSEPGLYYYRTGFTRADGQRTVRKGFFALLDLEPDDSGVVLPHESDWVNPRADRQPLLEATRAYVCPIFLLFNDTNREVISLLAGAADREAIIDTEDHIGQEHNVDRLTDPEVVREVQRLMAERTVTLADGHHRYRTAQAYAAAHPDDPSARKILACFVPIQDEGLYLQPIHRGVAGMPARQPDDLLLELSQTFYLRELAGEDAPDNLIDYALQELAQEAADNEPAFIMGLAGYPHLWLLTVKQDAAKLALPDGLAEPIRDLDVALLQRLILEGTLAL
ncbi:MAG: DUF1015 family protein, partial [Alphaproteobacteria bacterium]